MTDVQLHRVSTKALLDALRRHEALLTPSEQAVLDALTRKRGWFVTRSEIADALYGSREDGGPVAADRCVLTYVSNIRNKLPHLPIETKYYLGYRIAC